MPNRTGDFFASENIGSLFRYTVIIIDSPTHAETQGVTHQSKSIIENVVDKSIVLDTCRYLSIDKFNLSIKVDNHKILN